MQGTFLCQPRNSGKFHCPMAESHRQNSSGSRVLWITRERNSVSFQLILTDWVFWLQNPYITKSGAFFKFPCSHASQWQDWGRQGLCNLSPTITRQGCVSGRPQSSPWPLHWATAQAYARHILLAGRWDALFDPYSKLGTFISSLLIRKPDLREVK